MPFDPFGDFATKGYLRNYEGLSDPESVKQVEHSLFLANLEDAVGYLRRRKVIDYDCFLDVHEVLFSDFYPWAGQDRLKTAPDIYVLKGEIRFAAPTDIRRSVEYGLGLAHKNMRQNCGAVLGFFAHGHPFLDGNGRTILLVFGELCYRAGFGIAWEHTNKVDYLTALTQELDDPNAGALQTYLQPFFCQPIPHKTYSQLLGELPGLSGLDRFVDEAQEVAGYTTDDTAKASYDTYIARRKAAMDADLN